MESHTRGSWGLCGEPPGSEGLGRGWFSRFCLNQSDQGLCSRLGGLGMSSAWERLGVRSSPPAGGATGPGSEPPWSSPAPGPAELLSATGARGQLLSAGRPDLRDPAGAPATRADPTPVSGRLLSPSTSFLLPGPLPQASSQPGLDPPVPRPRAPPGHPDPWPGLASCSGRWSCPGTRGHPQSGTVVVQVDRATLSARPERTPLQAQCSLRR